MKKAVCIMLVALLLCSLAACQNKKIENPVNFYYLRTKYTYGSADSVISAEIREYPEADNTAGLITQYLKGPQDNLLSSEFPFGTKLVALEQQGRTISITLTDHISRLSGASLSLACVCLAKTVMEYTGAKTVFISAETKFLSNLSYITVTEDTILLVDDTAHATQQP